MTDAEWQRAVIERANGYCEMCGFIKIEATVAHHVVHRRFSIARYDIRNGVALCHRHHEMERTDRKYIEDICIEITIKRGDFKDRGSYDKWRQHVKTARVGIADRRKK